MINIDACDHLAYQPDGRPRSTFDAVQALLRHQMVASRPWLLFITTRVEPALLAGPGDAMRQAVNDNLATAAGFGEALAARLAASPAPLRIATGLGGVLLEHGCRIAHERGFTLVWARARDAALAFYERHGFTVEGDGFIDQATQMPHHVITRALG